MADIWNCWWITKRNYKETLALGYQSGVWQTYGGSGSMITKLHHIQLKPIDGIIQQCGHQEQQSCLLMVNKYFHMLTTEIMVIQHDIWQL